MPAGRCMSLGLGIVIGFASSWAVAAESGSAVDKALEQAKQTGLPILAVAGSKT